MLRHLKAATRLCIALLIATGYPTAAAQAQGGAELRPALLDVTVNGQRSPEPVLFLRGPDGALYASAPAFGAWRMRLPPGEPVRFDGEIFYRLSSLPGLRVTIDEQAQAVTIDAGAATFDRQTASLSQADAMPMTRPNTGVFLNYDVFVEHARGDTRATGAFELAVSTRHGVGATTFIAGAGAGPERLVRLETNWSIDWPDRAASLRIGDAVSSAGPGAAPVRFAGVHYFRNYAVQPGFITMPLPSSAGSATVPSVVDVYVNNVLQSSREVAPGPFELSNIPVQSGGGTVQLVVRDLLGREMVSEQAYYASTQALSRGLHDFSYEAGFIRRDFGRRSNAYGGFMASTTHRYGLTDRITLEGHAQASRSRQMAGAAITLLAFDLGQLGASASLSRSERGAGYRLAASFDRHTPSLSFGARAEYASADFAFIGMPDGFRPPRFTAQAFADLPFRGGSVGVSFLHRDLRGEPNETLAGLFGSVQVSRAVSVQLFARHAIVGSRQTIAGAHLALALGGRRSASASMERNRHGVSGYVGYQNDPPAGVGGGYRAAVSFGPRLGAEAAYVHNLPMATVMAQVGHANGATGVRLSASGAVGLIGRDVFASRSLGQSFAAVRVDGYPGLRVYADDQLVGVTGRSGALIVPGLRPFEANRIRVDESDLPMDAQIETTETAVRPFAGTGTVIRFAVRRERGVLMHVRREDGSNLPAGATVHAEGQQAPFVVASGGEVYVTGISGNAALRASWEGGSCGFSVAVPDNDDPQPRIDRITCRSARYAGQ